MDLILKKGDKIIYGNYWDRDEKGLAEVIDIEDTIFQPVEEIKPNEITYTVRDLKTNEEFVLDDVDYWFEVMV
jgi:hypothetical protein